MKKLIYLFLLLAFSCTQKSNEKSFPVLTGDYFGQDLPGNMPMLFAPGIISTGAGERDFIVSPDGKEIYFTREVAKFNYATIFVSKLKDGKWTEPEVPEIFSNPEYLYFEPHLSPDGKKMFFVSNMPVDSTKQGNEDIWVTEREGEEWGKPYNIGAPINTDSKEYFPSVTNDGTIYYTHLDKEKRDEFIYRAKFIDGKYQQPEKVEGVNIGRMRFNTLIARDESYMIVPAIGLTESLGGCDYYILFRNEKDNWSQPINMGSAVNSENMNEWSMSVSPDNKYFFFMSARIAKKDVDTKLSAKKLQNIFNSPQNGNSDVYWVSADFLEDLRTKAVFE